MPNNQTNKTIQPGNLVELCEKVPYLDITNERNFKIENTTKPEVAIVMSEETTKNSILFGLFGPKLCFKLLMGQQTIITSENYLKLIS
jgi:hypothetical protein